MAMAKYTMYHYKNVYRNLASNGWGYMKCRIFYHIRVDNAYILYSLQFKSLFKELHKSVIIYDKQNQIGVLTYILIKPFDRNK